MLEVNPEYFVRNTWSLEGLQASLIKETEIVDFIIIVALRI